MKKRLLYLIPIMALLVPAAVPALDYQGGANQLAGGFQPSNAPWGGFGGGSCTASKTPVVFLHGNGDEAKNWDLPTSTGAASVYDAFKAAGYNDCELFGLNWLSPSERGLPQHNYHQPAKADLIADFLWDVKAYTGASQVDVVAHSLGVTMALFAIDDGSLWTRELAGGWIPGLRLRGGKVKPLGDQSWVRLRAAFLEQSVAGVAWPCARS